MKDILIYEIINSITGNAMLFKEGVITKCSFEEIARVRNHLIHLGINPAIVNTMKEEWLVIGD